MQKRAFLVESLEPPQPDPISYWERVVSAFGAFQPTNARLMDDRFLVVVLDVPSLREAARRHTLFDSAIHNLRMQLLGEFAKHQLAFSIVHHRLESRESTIDELQAHVTKFLEVVTDAHGTVIYPTGEGTLDHEFESELSRVDRKMKMRTGDVRRFAGSPTEKEASLWGLDKTFAD